MVALRLAVVPTDDSNAPARWITRKLRKAERFQFLRDELGDAFVGIELDDDAAAEVHTQSTTPTPDSGAPCSEALMNMWTGVPTFQSHGMLNLP